MDKIPANLQQKLTCHPFHPQHSLILGHDHSQKKCSTCNQTFYSTSIYQCSLSSCEFKMCWKCSTLKANLVYPGHLHELCFMEKMEDDLECNADDCYFRADELKSVPSHEQLQNNTCSFIFRCVPCNFNIVHLLCGPLPPTVKHKYHMHPLDFRPVFAEDDSGEYYCHVCESERDPRFGFYYCEPCKFVAHAHCLIDELTSMLRGADTSTQRFEGDNDEPLSYMKMRAGITLKDVLCNLSKEDKERFKQHFDWNDTSCDQIGNSSTSSKPQSQDNGVGKIPEEYYFPGSNMDFQRLFYSFDKYCNFRRLKLEPSDLEMRLAKVEKYMVGWTLSSHLKKLLDKHGDVSCRSQLTPEMKSLGFHFLCKVLYGMRKTIVNNIREEHLRDWYGYLKFVTRMGFRIDFVYSKLEKAKHVFFDVHAKNLEAEVPKRLNDKKAELETQLAKIHVELQKFEEYRKSYAQWKKTSKSYSDGRSELIWKTAYECTIAQHSKSGD